MAKRIRVAIVVLVILAVLVTMVAAVTYALRYKEIERDQLDAPQYYMPDGAEVIDLELPDENASQEEVIAFAAELYRIACENYKNAEKAAFIVQYNSKMNMLGMAMPVPGERYCVKDGDKRYYLDFAIPDEGNAMSSLAGYFAPSSSHYAEAVYSDSTLVDENGDPAMISRKVYKGSGADKSGIAPSYVDKGEGTKVVSVNWDSCDETYLPQTVYYAGQEGEFHHTDHEVTVDTILSATVSYTEISEGEGYYTVDFELDPDKVPQSLLDSLRVSSECPDAHYTKLVQSMTIWNTGYFRTYHALDSWEGKRSIMSLSSDLDFMTTYYYENQPEKLDINNYPYMAEMCHK